ncbi:MAG: glycoside hydrolase [Muribaculaceae bacterium]|nr:glycoside hydrolase [Muribaculaceae bacterium]
MKKLFLYGAAAFVAVSCICACKSSENTVQVEPSYEIVTYVWDGGDRMPDPSLVTTINYAFANVNDTRDGVVINHEPRFRSIVALKEKNPDLKVLLCIGGSCKSGLSEMAADSLKRAALADDCARIIKEYGIDGIDFDWEFPGGEGGTPDDYKNFALVLKAVRKAIGDDKLLTLAAGGDLAGMDVDNVPAFLDVLDYVNVMAYDLSGTPDTHHTPLYRSKFTGWRSVDEVVQDYVAHGVPYDKMMLGLGFYGRGDGVHYLQWTDTESAKPYDDLSEEWDSVGMVPYIADANGVLTVGYENPRSIEIKCDYIKEKGFRGAMNWRTELDLDSMQLARTVARNLRNIE